MRCERCGRDFAAGLGKCPHCGAAAHYGGNTEFYEKVVGSKLTVADLFTDVFKKHPKGAGARMFMAGTPLSTPTPDRMLSEWQKPWLFARVLAVGLLFGLLLLFNLRQGYTSGVFSFLSLGCMIIPIGILIFFWEVNIPRDIPLYTVLLIFLIGGILSLIFPDYFGQRNITSETAYLAAFTEEPAKLLALSIFIYILDTKYIFGGMLIGAAVGTGFAVMETIGYVMNGMLEGLFASGEFDVGIYVGVYTLVLRSVLAIGGHVSWAAIEGGALAAVKQGEKLNLRHFADPRFLIYLAASVGMHFTWNGGLTQLLGLPESTATNFVLCAAAVFVLFTLLKKAVAQVLAVADGAQFVRRPEVQRPGQSRAAGQAVLSALSGPLAGAEFPFGQSVTIGCDPSQCNIVLPAGTPGVSRRHCTLELRPDGVYLMDHNSSYGTFWQSGQRIAPQQWTAVSGPFCLGSQAVAFTCR